MSITGAIRTAFLAEVTTAITTGAVLEGAIEPSKIPTADMPHAQAFDLAMNVTGELVWRIEEQLHAFTVVITDHDKTEEQMETHFDDIITQLDTNRTLGSTVKWCKVPAKGANERVDKEGKRRIIAFEVVAEVFR